MKAIDIAAQKIQMNHDAETLEAWITALAALAEDYEATRLEMEEDRFVRASCRRKRPKEQNGNQILGLVTAWLTRWLQTGLCTTTKPGAF
ncbi:MULTISPECIES: hypothetical protein [unclassified Ensifer]|uniref:hypothetical protein n=1 Tax=unclassified Ensifer TaxID=2633371 RepID=UPI000709617C|nr:MULTISPECIES: hypothetical protein [unclassified Ensifer]KQW33519.1 hypothetical protein ASD02_18925 [Ensifer sp. Root1252]KRC78693.1 hypothetical protein ASE32_26895 [Ensifer sp. Root231]KRD02596.1 hypothetical protein ASE47_19985 [Ensifer sp. Root258]